MRRKPTPLAPPTQGDDHVPSLREALRELFAVTVLKPPMEPSCSPLTGPFPAAQMSLQLGQSRDQSGGLARHLGDAGHGL
jgi:hypothetical protein